jgi:hypothetical protein
VYIRRCSPRSFRVAINSRSPPGCHVVAPAGPSEPQRGNVQRSLLKRVERLERDPRWQPPPPPTGADLLFRKKAQQLLREVDERYARLVVADLQRNSHDPGRWSGLTVEFLMRAADHVRGGLPLAFPAAVAEAYLSNPHAGHATACQQCRYKLPSAYFKLCPVCDAPVCSSQLDHNHETGSIRNQW